MADTLRKIDESISRCNFESPAGEPHYEQMPADARLPEFPSSFDWGATKIVNAPKAQHPLTQPLTLGVANQKANELIHQAMSMANADSAFGQSDKGVADYLAEIINKLDPQSGVINQVYRVLDSGLQDLHGLAQGSYSRYWSELSDDLTRAWFKLAGAEKMSQLPLSTRRLILQSVREGFISKEDKEIYNALSPATERDAYLKNTEFAYGANEAARDYAAACKRIDLDADPMDNHSVKFRGKVIAADPVADSQPIMEFVYPKLLKLGVKNFNTQEEINKAWVEAGKLLAANPKKPIDRTLIIRPGLGNVPMSAAWLATAGRFLGTQGRIILTHSYDDGTAKGALRPLRDFPENSGNLLPKELQGKIFVVGTPEMVFQSIRRDAGLFIKQLNEIDENAKRFRFDLNKVTFINHSQGNPTTLKGLDTLEAHGITFPNAEFIALAQATRGSLLTDSNPVLNTVGLALGGTQAREAILSLDPDATEKLISEDNRRRVDIAFFGDQMRKPSSVANHPALRYGAAPTEEGLTKPGGDGLVDMRATTFLKDGGTLHIFEKGFDHNAIFKDPEAARIIFQTYLR